MINYKVGNLVANTEDFSNIIAKIEGSKNCDIIKPSLKEMVGLLLSPVLYYLNILFIWWWIKHQIDILKRSKLKIIKTDRMNPICFNSWAITNIQASGESEIAAIYRRGTKSLNEFDILWISPHVKDDQTSVVIKSLLTASACSRSVDKFEHDK